MEPGVPSELQLTPDYRDRVARLENSWTFGGEAWVDISMAYMRRLCSVPAQSFFPYSGSYSD